MAQSHHNLFDTVTPGISSDDGSVLLHQLTCIYRQTAFHQISFVLRSACSKHLNLPFLTTIRS